MLRIGVDARELQRRPTGVGRYLRNLLRAWPAGDRLFLYSNGPLAPLLPGEAFTSRPLGPARRGLVWQERLLPSAAREDRIDLFFAPAYSCPLGLTVPRVTAIHDLSFFSLPEDFTAVDGLRRRLTVAASVRASRRIVVPSAFTRREIAARFPEAVARLRVIADAPADDLPPALPREEARRRLDVRGPLVLTVGAILNRRRLPTLLRAVAALRRRRPEVLLDVVGENRTHPRLDLGSLVRRLGVADAVRLSGYVSDEGLALRYAAADAFAYLSEYEGFGLPVLEAMARALPVVTADRPCLSEVFAEAALFVDPRDELALATALEAVLADDRLRADLAARGLSLARRLSWGETARLTRQALAEAAA